MESKKVNFNDKFFIINNESFFYETSETMKKEGAEDRKFMQYQWVIPMHVKSINNNFDGIESFDLCPVDITTLKDHKEGWRWSRNFEYDEIGKTIFYTEKECWDFYNKRYSENDKKVYEELRRLRFLQERSSVLL
jgi:hypothetical protein